MLEIPLKIKCRILKWKNGGEQEKGRGRQSKNQSVAMYTLPVYTETRSLQPRPNVLRGLLAHQDDSSRHRPGLSELQDTNEYHTTEHTTDEKDRRQRTHNG